MALYLPAGLFGHEEPAGLTAARLSDALRFPVLLLHYRPAPANTYPDVQDALAGRHPALRIVVLGHSAGALEDPAPRRVRRRQQGARVAGQGPRPPGCHAS